MEKISKKNCFLNENKIIKKLGHYTKSNYNNAFVVIASNGITPTIMENHGAVLATVVRKKKYENNKKLH